ncbi:helix-turn-helix domain-containing protein [Pantoea sp. B65]|uniref:IclR family transcriptional regulator domain-containing protein n=1 Tax=Pantoea sp. B65 TaxID=2813359 RepID=UPI0039B44533
MSSQPNQSLIDGIRCLQYLISNGHSVGCRELARLMGLNVTRVNRLLMTLASMGLAEQDEHRRYRPGHGIHALAAQAIRGSSLFSQTLPLLEQHAPADLTVAMGVLWEDKVIYIYHSEPGLQVSQALAGFNTLPVWESVIGMALLAAEDDDALRPRFTPAQWQTLYPHLVEKRKHGHVVWRHNDGEVSMARTIGSNRAAIAFAGMYQYHETAINDRLLALKTLAGQLNQALVFNPQ